MSITWTIRNDRRMITQVLRFDSHTEVLPRKVHKRYTAITPQRIHECLGGSEFNVKTHWYAMNARTHAARAGQAVLEVTPKLDATPLDFDGDAHRQGVLIYLDHQGKSSVLLKRGVFRIACQNAFYCPDMRIHHCSGEARSFFLNPLPYIREVMNRGTTVLNTLNSFKQLEGNAETVPLFVQSKARLLGRKVAGAYREYSYEHGNTMWSAMQALTEPKNRRLDEFCGRLLADRGFKERSWDEDVLGAYQRMEALWN